MSQLRAGGRSSDSFSGSGLRRWGPLAVVVVGVSAAIGLLLFTQGRSHDNAIASATAAAKPWELVGPPCQEGFSGPWASPQYAPTKSLVFNDIRFTRRAGHVECSAVAAGEGASEDYVPLCQFTGPILVEVTTPKGVFRFQPDVGKPATVSVVDGQPRCVLAANAQF